MKKIFVIATTLALLVSSLAGCSSTSSDTYKEDTATSTQTTSADVYADTANESATTATTFTVGFDQDFPPMGFVGEDGEFTGFDLDLAKEVASRLNLELKLQPIAWDSKDMELESKNVDCIWNGFTINGREENYTWTTPYMANEQVFVVRTDSGIASLADLAGKVVTVQADSSAEAALKDKADLVASFGNYMTAADYNTALLDLESGAVDAVAMDSIVANYQIEKRGEKFSVLSESIATEEYGVGFLLGNTELRDQVQSTLEAMAADGTLTKISETWFGKDVTTIGKK